ncbi:hypothetical protein CSQ96_17765 [Janthinobacterium sp. BJB412]|nr:hypothetical protein CSQ96_17765 [Janthinobacterium sp. BJB412]
MADCRQLCSTVNCSLLLGSWAAADRLLSIVLDWGRSTYAHTALKPLLPILLFGARIGRKVGKPVNLMG